VKLEQDFPAFEEADRTGGLAHHQGEACGAGGDACGSRMTSA
jgi:hypothetical protein